MLYIENSNLQKDKDISLVMEIYRGIEYCNLHDKFLKSCIDNLGSNVFNIKKKYSRTISNLLSSWMFTLYSYYDFLDDPFFPTNYNYFENLITTLNDYSSLHNIKNKNTKINNIINDLKNNYKMILINLKKIKTTNGVSLQKVATLQCVYNRSLLTGKCFIRPWLLYDIAVSIGFSPNKFLSVVFVLPRFPKNLTILSYPKRIAS